MKQTNKPGSYNRVECWMLAVYPREAMLSPEIASKMKESVSGYVRVLGSR
jgi:hypothetical protein